MNNKVFGFTKNNNHGVEIYYLYILIITPGNNIKCDTVQCVLFAHASISLILTALGVILKFL